MSDGFGSSVKRFKIGMELSMFGGEVLESTENQLIIDEVVYDYRASFDDEEAADSFLANTDWKITKNLKKQKKGYSADGEVVEWCELYFSVS